MSCGSELRLGIAKLDTQTPPNMPRLGAYEAYMTCDGERMEEYQTFEDKGDSTDTVTCYVASENGKASAIPSCLYTLRTLPFR